MSDAGRSSAGRIAAVRAAATYELVVEQMRKAIYLGRFLPGEKLPPERELANQMGVSRTTIREAVRVLEGEGLISVRRGASGGLVVLGHQPLSSRQVEAWLRTQEGMIDTVFDFRLAVECTAAALAAERRSSGDLVALEAALDRMEELSATPEARRQTENIARFFAADSAFHLGIATASKNELLIKAVEEARAAMFLPIGSVFRKLEDNANAHHAAVFQAIKRRRADVAADEMRRHIEGTRSSLRRFLAGALARGSGGNGRAAQVARRRSA